MEEKEKQVNESIKNLSKGITSLESKLEKLVEDQSNKVLEDNITELSNRITEQSKQQEKEQYEEKIKQLEDKLKPNEKSDKQKEPWYGTLTKILGIPALIIAMFFQLNQTKNSDSLNEKTQAETEKIKTEDLIARAELQNLLSELERSDSINIDSHQTKIDETLPKIELLLTKIESFNTSKQVSIEYDTFSKYVLYYIFIVGIGIFFDLFGQVWNMILGFYMNLIYKQTQYRNGKEPSKFKKRLRNISEYALPILSPLPYISRVVVDIFVFIVILIPFFNEVVTNIAAENDFNMIFENLKKIDFVGAIEKLKNNLFN